MDKGQGMSALQTIKRTMPRMQLNPIGKQK